MLQTNNTGVCSQCLSQTGFAPIHSVCAFPVYTALGSRLLCQELLRPALDCMHFPGLSRSGSGSQVLHRNADSVEPVFVPFPGPSSSGDEVFGDRGHCDLSPTPSLSLSFLGVQPVHLLRLMLTIKNPKKS